MSAPDIQFKIVTPERTVFSGDVTSVSLMTAMGEITILPNHIPLVGIVRPGELRYVQAGEQQYLATAGGYVEVRGGNQVIVLADAAERVEEIDLTRAQTARERAEKLLTERQFANDIEFAGLQAALERSLVRIRVAKRRPHAGSR